MQALLTILLMAEEKLTVLAEARQEADKKNSARIKFSETKWGGSAKNWPWGGSQLPQRERTFWPLLRASFKNYKGGK